MRPEEKIEHHPTIDSGRHSRRLVLVSNRLPIEAKLQDSEWIVKPTTGGLVTACAPIMEKTDGIWLGYAGQLDTEGSNAINIASNGRFAPIKIPQQLYDRYYGEVANRVYWGVSHGLLEYANLTGYAANYPAYEEVNGIVAQEVVKQAQIGDIIFIQDYHLYQVGKKAKELLRSQSLSKDILLPFFSHIPFPSAEYLSVLPNKEEILIGLLAYDLVGFQTEEYKQNFIRCVKSFIPDAVIEQTTAGVVVTTIIDQNSEAENRTKIGTYPVSVDSATLAGRRSEFLSMAKEVREKLGLNGGVIAVDGGRADFTKGTHHTLKAVDLFLQRYPRWKGNFTFVQILQPSREDLPEYQRYNKRTHDLITDINQRHAKGRTDQWKPIVYQPGLPYSQLMALLAMTDIALIAPLADGMNLVCKEYAVVGPEHGVLVLGRGTGAAQELAEGALLVEPYDTYGYSEAIHTAVTMQNEERKLRKRILFNQVLNNNNFTWIDQLLADL